MSATTSEQLSELKRHIEGCAESMNRSIQAALNAGMRVAIEPVGSTGVTVHVSHVEGGIYRLVVARIGDGI